MDIEIADFGEKKQGRVRIRQGVATHKPEIVKKLLGGDDESRCRKKVAINKGSLEQSQLYQVQVTVLQRNDFPT